MSSWIEKMLRPPSLEHAARKNKNIGASYRSTTLRHRAAGESAAMGTGGRVAGRQRQGGARPASGGGGTARGARASGGRRGIPRQRAPGSQDSGDGSPRSARRR